MLDPLVARRLTGTGQEIAGDVADALDPPIRVGISACILGDRARNDSGHEHRRFLTDALGRYFEWVPVCPDVEPGPVRIDLRSEDLSGCLMEKDSRRDLFAAALTERLPNLPIEHEGRLCDPRLRENWIERVFAYRRVQAMWAARWRLGNLIAFHTAYKLTLLAHSPHAYRQLGRLVAGARERALSEIRERYEREFMSALAKIPTPGRHANVLQHVVGICATSSTTALDARCSIVSRSIDGESSAGSRLSGSSRTIYRCMTSNTSGARCISPRIPRSSLR